MKLKRYQEKALDRLEAFCTDAVLRGPERAFNDITGERAVAETLGTMFSPYKPLEGLPQVPRVCLRLPTGAGKTIIAAHAIPRISKALLGTSGAAKPTVIWFAPSNAIRTQTLQALRDPYHPYHRALRDQLGTINVFDVDDFDLLPAQDIGTKANIFVSTIQALKVEDTDIRRAYAHNEDLEPHFARLLARATQTGELEAVSDTDLSPRFSFANLLHLVRPIMIVDEAHNAVTGLTDVMQKRLNPCAVLELTATPRPANNTLYNVGVDAVHKAAMIKLPIRLRLDREWETTLLKAVQQREALERLAERDPKYIRPIALYQAEKKNLAVPVERLREFLVEELNVPEEQIAIATGTVRDLDGHDLLSPTGPASEIRHVITVQALKEGWDCPFAYVFASVANVKSKTDAEQLLGRVMRQPFTEFRVQPELNRAYAFLASSDFHDTVGTLREKLVSGLGLTEGEVDDAVEFEQPELDHGLFGPRSPTPPRSDAVAIVTPEVADAVEKAATTARVAPNADGTSSITFDGVPGKAEIDAIADQLPDDLKAEFKTRASAYREKNAARTSPADEGEILFLPGLSADMDGRVVPLDPDTYADFADFSLKDLDPTLSVHDFRLQDKGGEFVLGLRDGEIQYAAAEPTGLMDSLGLLDLDIAALAGRLARELRHPMTGHGELVGWVSRALSHLTDKRGLDATQIAAAIFPLARVLRQRLNTHRDTRTQAVFESVLRDGRLRLGQEGFTFRHGMFADVRTQPRDGYAWSKHFLGPDRIPAFDGKSLGDEVLAARDVDSHPAVQYWARNPSQHRESFRLPLSQNNFYPDFVAKLIDGRLAVIEYKGEHLADGSDTREKVAVGRAWEAVMQGRGVFVLLEKQSEAGNVREQLDAAFQ